MEVNRDVTRRDIQDFLVRDIIYDLDRLEEAKLALVAVLEDMQQEESKN